MEKEEVFEKKESSEDIYMKKSGTDYYEVFEEPKFYIKRKIFAIEERDFLHFEKRKVELLRNNFLDDKVLQKKIKLMNLEDFFAKLVLDSLQDTVRYLNTFAYDVDRSINSLHKLLEVIKKLKITPDVIENKDYKETVNFMYMIGKDNSDRPIIGIDVMQLAFIQGEKLTTLNLIRSLINKLNKILNSELTPGKAEQVVVFLDMGDLSQNELLPNHSDIIKLFQYIYPSRLGKMYVATSSQSKNTFVLIQKSLIEYNSERVRFFDLNNKNFIKKMTEQINPDYINNFFVNKIRNSIHTISEGSLMCYLNKEYSDMQRPFALEHNREENLFDNNLSSSKRNNISHNNSTWINSNFKIDNCNAITIRKTILESKLTICHHESFILNENVNQIKIKKTIQQFDFYNENEENSVNVIKARSGNIRATKNKVVFERQTNEVCCSGAEICTIL